LAFSFYFILFYTLHPHLEDLATNGKGGKRPLRCVYRLFHDDPGLLNDLGQ